jgi:anhydro-N-acetylmuramic acid kinase
MDQYVQANFQSMHYDVDGLIAAEGEVNLELLNQMLEFKFFRLPFPKTTGPELFNLNFLTSAQTKSNTQDISPQNVLATLNRLTATVIGDSIKRCIRNEELVTVYFSGGGIHNKLLIAQLRADLPTIRFTTTDELGILPDAKEAVLFALLANETLAGDPIDFGQRSGLPSVSMGKICLPF